MMRTRYLELEDAPHDDRNGTNWHRAQVTAEWLDRHVQAPTRPPARAAKCRCRGNVRLPEILRHGDLRCQSGRLAATPLPQATCVDDGSETRLVVAYPTPRCPVSRARWAWASRRWSR